MDFFHQVHFKVSAVYPLFATGVIAAGVVDTGGQFFAVINDTSSIGFKIAGGVVDTGGKFATVVVDTSGAS